MQTDLLLADPCLDRDNWVESYVSLKSFIGFLREQVEKSDGIKSKYYKFLLDKIMQHPELEGDVPASEMHKFKPLLEMISTVLFPLMEDEDVALWGLGNALTPEVFYGSNALYKVLALKSEIHTSDGYVGDEAGTSLMLKEFIYQFIIKTLYHIPVQNSREWIHGFIDPATGLYKYFRINLDNRFTEVRAKEPLPAMANDYVKSCLSSLDVYEKLEEMLPLKNFIASGFTIIVLTDITVHYAREELAKVLLNMHDGNKQDVMAHINRLLQTIIADPNYNFGMMPIFNINNRTGLLYENMPFSTITKICNEHGVPKRTFDRFISRYAQNPEPLTYWPSSNRKELTEPINLAFEEEMITYYSLTPVYNPANKQLIGLFEISTKGDSMLDEKYLYNTLMPVLPSISLLLLHFLDKFDRSIDAVIKDKFTTLQSSVQWKFNEVAWHFLRDNIVENRKVSIEPVVFSGVYPLYGAIDIQNSTIERNKALRKDLLVQLTALQEILQAIAANFDNVREELLHECDKWLYCLSDFITIEQELLLNDFIHLEVDPYLIKFEFKTKAGIAQKIKEYRDAINEAKGVAFAERRKLEFSIQLINSSLGNYFDQFRDELQNIYPSYFEKVRTDGVEYDVYMGQSIAPKIPFEQTHLEKARLLQLQSMAGVTKLTASLMPQMEHPLATTQLVFVHSRPIDISFRNDERRFDVEGAYNIRYHIIKKRIDKVHLLNSEERLTQVGKIALVYYNEKDVAEYEAYIKQLQQMKILKDDLEHLELEELQGVSGLKALRVGVVLYEDHAS